MPDRITLIAKIGAQIATLEAAGDGETAGVLRDALAQIVADAGIVAAEEQRRAKDRRRHGKKDDPAPAPDSGNSGNSSVSAESAEFRETPPAPSGKRRAHITRALALEVQEQDQKQEQEIANAISPGETPGNGEADADGDARPEIPAFGALELTGDPPSPPPFDPALMLGIGRISHVSAHQIRRAVDHVVAHFLARHPRRRPGEKDRKLIARHLRTYTPNELCDAIDGNADDAWAAGIGKHELSWTLRDNGKIDDYREKANREAETAEAVLHNAEQTGWA